MKKGRAYRVGRGVLGVASVFVPAGRRGAWREEWCGELWELCRRKAGPGGRRGKAISVAAYLGGVPSSVLWEWRDAWLRDVRGDVRYGVRTLLRAPGFTVVAVLMLALGIGANTTMFTIVNAVFVRPPPLVAAPGELVRFTRITESGVVAGSMTYPDYEYYRDDNAAFSGVVAARYSGTAVMVADGDRVVQAAAGYVSGNYFDVLGVPMVRGRSFLPEENETPGTHAVVILSGGFWSRQLGADPGVVGRTLTLNGVAYTVVGVAPAGFRGVSPVEEAPDLFLPAMMRGFGLQRVDGEYSYGWEVIGRLRRGIDIASAQADIDRLQSRWREVFARWIAASDPPEGRLVLTSRYALAPGAGRSLGELTRLLFLVVVVVLVIACANVALLQLARASARVREIGIRHALGAGRGRVTRQLFVENLLLALAGGAGGLAIATWCTGLVTRLVPYSFSTGFSPDASVAVFTVLLSVSAAILFGMVPVRQLGRAEVLSSVSRGSGVPRTSAVQAALVVGQVALSVPLIVGAGLFGRSLIAAQRVDPGFAPEGRLLATVALGNSGYDEEDGLALVRSVLGRLGELPGVEAVSTTQQLPFRGAWTETVRVPGAGGAGAGFDTGFNRVGPDYFSVMGIPVLAGRDFTRSDDRAGPLSMVINEALANRLWPGENAVGRLLVYQGRSWTVVGVAANALYYHVGEAAQPQAYVPQLQDYSPVVTFMVAVRDRSPDLTQSVRDVIHAYDPALPIHSVESLRDTVSAVIGPYRVTAILTAVFGGLALLLAALGLFGVQSYLVARRAREIGIRMALGAGEGDAAGVVIGRGVRLTAIGILLGVAAGLASAGVIERMLFGVSSRDPVTFVAAPLVLLAVSVIASVVPARRASRVDPLLVLREE